MNLNMNITGEVLCAKVVGMISSEGFSSMSLHMEHLTHLPGCNWKVTVGLTECGGNLALANRVSQVMCVVLRLNRPCAAAVRPYVKLL